MTATTEQEGEQTDDEQLAVEPIDGVEDDLDAQTVEEMAVSSYDITVEQRTMTDDETGETYTLWKARGSPSVDAPVEDEVAVSAHLPEAIMDLCETLERVYGGVV